MNFAEWFDRVDRLCRNRYCMSIMDLPDMNFHDAFDGEVSPEAFLEAFLDEFLPDCEALREIILS